LLTYLIAALRAAAPSSSSSSLKPQAPSLIPMPQFSDLTSAVTQAQTDLATYNAAQQAQLASQQALATATTNANQSIQAAQADLQAKTTALAAAAQTVSDDEQSIDNLAHQLLTGALQAAPAAAVPATADQAAAAEAAAPPLPEQPSS
jgi:hypothetical protein